MFAEQDLRQIAEHGLSPEQVELQLENFRRGFPPLNVVRAASPGDGVPPFCYGKKGRRGGAAAERARGFHFPPGKNQKKMIFVFTSR